MALDPVRPDRAPPDYACIDDWRFIPAGCDTIAKLFWHRVQTHGPSLAMTHKEFGIWQRITWSQYGERAKWTGLALATLGLKPGDVAGILSESIPEWLWTDYGIICSGAISVGLYPTSSRDQVEYILNDSRARFLFVEDEEQLDKILERRERLPHLVRVIVYDMTGLKKFSDPLVMSYAQLLELGRAEDEKRPDLWPQLVGRATPDDAAIFVYTSGTTGPPKGAMLSHRNLIFAIDRWGDMAPTTDGDDTLAFLPLCHMAERMMTGLRPLNYGGVVNFAESPDTVMENLQEVAPTVFFAVPRIWEKLHSLVVMTLQDGTALERFVYNQAMRVAYKVADRKMAHQPISAWLRVQYALADLFVLRNTKRMLGLGRARLIGSGAAPISSEVMRWYVALGLNMFELYGQTECSGIATYYQPTDYALGKVGRAIRGTELKIGPDGEIMLRGPYVFMGYHNKAEKTADAIRDGWLFTGDVGMVGNDGMLKLTDRKSDIIITSGGKNITPTEIENKLKFSPYITDAIVIGDARNYITALIMIDQDNVMKYAQTNRIPFTDYASLTRAAGIHELIQAEIDNVNKTLSNVETIKKFRLLQLLLTAEDEEMTPTLKLRRKFVNQKYKGEIDAMYGGG
ncbi:MAG: long-chain fatty acid--CoA ligase [Alphaproteobacteria bacterium]